VEDKEKVTFEKGKKGVSLKISSRGKSLSEGKGRGKLGKLRNSRKIQGKRQSLFDLKFRGRKEPTIAACYTFTGRKKGGHLGRSVNTRSEGRKRQKDDA